MSKSLKAFITYSHKDDQKRKQLRTRLAVMERNGEIKPRDDTDIAAGGKARQEDILKEVANSDILLYLVSADSLASENCNKELTEAVRLGKRVIPIILESCDWLYDRLSNFQALPTKGKPINKWQPESDGWQNVVERIREAVEEMQAQSNSSSETSESELRAELAFQHGNILMMLGQIDEAIEHYSHAITLNPNNADAYHNRGVAYHAKGDFDRAIEDYTEVIKRNSNYAIAYSNRGDAYRNKDDYDRAIEDCSKAIGLNPDYAEAYYNRGIAYENKGDYDRAIINYTKAIDLNPNYANAYNNRGVTYEKKSDFDRAIEDYTQVINLKPDFIIPYINRASVYDRKGDFDRAIEDYTQVINLKPDFVEVYNNRGVAYHGKGDFDCAIEDYNRAIDLKPNNAEAYYNCGIAYGEKRNYDRAISEYTKAIALNPDYVEAYSNRGNTYREKGDFDRAIQDYTKAINLNPDSAEAYSNRGNTYREKGDFDRAIQDYNTAIELKPDAADTYHNRGAAYGTYKGKFDRAIQDYNTVIELKPDAADTYHNRGAAYGNTGDFDRAIGDYTKAIQLNPDSTEAYYNRGVAYHSTGDFDHAIGNYTKAIQLNPDSTEAYYNRGVAYENTGDFDRAIGDYTKAIQLNPDYAIAYYNRGVAYHSTGDFDHAIGDYTKAIQLNPDSVETYHNRGVAYYIKGDFDRAIGDYTKAIQLNPDSTEAYHNRGVAYHGIGDFDHAIIDYTKAIQLKPDLAEAYYYRGTVWLHLREWDKAKADLMTTKNMGLDITAAFHNEYKNVEAYERANRVKLPEDIALMLTQRRRSRFPRTQKLLREDGTPFESPDILNLLAKLRNAGPPLSQYLQIPRGEDARRVGTRSAFGIKTGASGAFVVDSATRDQLIADHPASADILKPFLHGRDIRRWQVESLDSWLIFAHRRIEINRYPAIRKHLEQYRSVLSKRAGKQKWYELPTTKRGTELFTQTKLICPNSYDHQTFAVDTDGFYCGDTCYLIPTEETWLCGLLNSRIVEWFYSQASNQLTVDYLRARSRHIQEIPIPNLTPTQKSLIGKIVDYLIFLQVQPTTNSRDLAHARDAVMLRYFERIIDGLAYESYLSEELHQGEKQFFKPLLAERLPQLEEIRGDKMAALQEIFECLYERTHPIRRNLFFLDSVKPIRIIEDRT